MTQALDTHDAAAFVKEQARPQPPQCAVVFVVFVSQPFTTLPSQLAYGATHVGTQSPLVHVVVPLAAVGCVHVVAHVPQLETC